MRGYCILRTRGAMRAALVWVHPVKIDKQTVSSPPEARSSPPERFWGVEHGSALGRAPLLRTARARSRVGGQTRGGWWWVVVGEKWPILPQIGRWGVRGRLVVVMGHIRACGVVVVSVGGVHGPWSVLAARSRRRGGTRRVMRHVRTSVLPRCHARHLTTATLAASTEHGP